MRFTGRSSEKRGETKKKSGNGAKREGRKEEMVQLRVSFRAVVTINPVSP